MPELRSEDAAKRATAKGWACVKCGRFFWGNDIAAERSARYCCATSFPCECGGRHEKGWTCCPECRRKMTAERWRKLERVEWDGKTPLARFTGHDKFFWTPDELAEYLYDEELALGDVMLVICTPDSGGIFEMIEYLCDSLPEDGGGDLDTREIDEIVNKWLKEHGPFSWWGGKTVPSDESLRRVLALKE
jgi:hypothetical protein